VTMNRSDRLTRRQVLTTGAGLTAVGAAAVIGGVYATGHRGNSGTGGDALDAPTPDVTPVDPGDLQLRVSDDGSHPGRVSVLTAADHGGRELFHIDGYRFDGSTATRGATVDDPSAGQPGPGPVRVDFQVDRPDWSASVTLRAEGGRVTMDWELGVPDGTAEDALSGGAMYRTLVDAHDGPATDRHVPATRWARDPRGGVPFHERVTEIHAVDWDDGDGRIRGVFTVPGGTTAGQSTLTAPPARGDDGVWRTTVDFRTDPAAAEARALIDDGRPLLAGGVLGHPDLPDPLVDVTGPGRYNLADSGGTRTFTVGAAGSPGSTTVDVTARDLDGTELHRSTVTVDIPADSRHGDGTVDIDLPGPRCWAAVDVSCGTSFARTGTAVWPQPDAVPADRSLAGLGGFASDPGGGSTQQPGLEPADAEHALWGRLGVRHLRNPWLSAAESSDLGIRTAVQPAGRPGDFTGDGPGTFDEWAASALDRGDAAGAEHYELLNEWNTDDVSAQDRAARAAEYSDSWLKPFRAEMDRRGSTAKLLNMAIAGWDPDFLDTVRDHGGWDLIDGIAEHPGRGNYTADYDGGRWNFLGQVRTARAYLDGHPTGGDNELWLTEVYACTQPNSWWNDDLRTAADAVFLSLALAAASGVTGVHWYQLTDGVWHDKYGVSPGDSEYHYGLFAVDRSPKPSAAAFAAAAGALGGAEFLGWVESPHPDLRGLRFARGDETFWVLWSRQDGYITTPDRTRQQTDDAFYPHPEPWDRPAWAGGTVTVTVPSDARATDVIGRDVAVDDGHVVVGSSPVVVRGTGRDDEGPTEVTGDARVPLSGVAVHRDGQTLVIDGSNGTGHPLTLKVTGRQVDGVLGEETVEVPAGDFSESVALGAAMPDGDGAGAQVRIVAEQREKVTPEAVQSQVYRAEYHRTV
jgi:hypothetical protein